MNNLDLQYQNLLRTILQAPVKPNRTGVDTRAIWGASIRHDMSEGFPLLTTKKLAHKSIRVELEGFLQGMTSKKWYQDRGCNIWNEWCNPQLLIHKDLITDEERKAFQKEQDDLGPIYGYQWRHWKKPVLVDAENGLYKMEEIDQVAEAIAGLKKDWTNRKKVITAWEPSDIPKMALDPCHYSWHCGVTVDEHGEKYLNLSWTQRSVDSFLGLPFNIASYGLLLTLMAKELNMKPGILNGDLHDVHIYVNHEEQCRTQIERQPFSLPTAEIPDFTSVLDWKHDQFILNDYQFHPALKGDVAV